MIPSRIWAVAALVALLGCGDKPAKPIDPAKVLPNLPLPPDPTIVSQSGGVDAAMVTYRSPASKSVVEAYYKGVLVPPQWRLVKHTTDRSGNVVMLAEQKGPPLWVRIRTTPDGAATLVDLAGGLAGTDTSGTAKPAS